MGPFIIPTHGMAGGLGSFSGGATLERSKLDTKREVKTVEPRLDDAGGGGGIGKGLSNGGGGDDDGGDDDDYGNGFGEGGDDGEGDGFFRAVLQQLYNPEALKAVLTEFSMTMADLPAMLRQSVEMGLFSSAMLHTFLTTDVRPSITRAVTRSMPQRWARGVVGRLMADPAFMQKLLIEEAITVGSSLYWEARQRGRNFWREADIVAANTLCLAGATGAAVWMLSPSRSHGTPHKWPWQNMLHNLPNHVFDASTPHRHFNLQTRLMGLATKAAELSLVGSIAGASMSLLNQGCVAAHRMVNPSFEPTAPVPTLAASSSGLAATLGLCANARYQVIGGIDRYLFDRCSMLWVYLIFSGAVRLVSNRVTEPIRLHLQGLPTKFPERKQRLQLTQEQAQLIQAYRQHQQRLQGQAAQHPAGQQQQQQQPAKKRSSKKKASRGFQMSAGLQPAT